MELSRAQFLRLAAGGLGALMIGRSAGATGASAATAPPAGGKMVTRPIPRSGELLPVIGLGTARTFDVGDDAAARARLAEVMRRFFAGGGRVIDTASAYGSAEAVLGDLLVALNARRSAFVATKVWAGSREEGIEQMRRSAQLLHCPVIDLMQVHNLSDWRTQLATLRAMKETGRIRYLGVTHYLSSALPELAGIVAHEEIDFVQCSYSIDERDAETRLLPLAADRGVAVLINQPLGRGNLFARVRTTPLPPWVAEFDCTSWAQFFLKYILANPAVTCVLPATGNPRHLRDDLAAGCGRLPDPVQRRRMASYWSSLT
jgi:aryl-alcohol dehydrogenase-like predicted oxidoreductase